VAFDGVTFNDRGMAAAERIGDAVARAVAFGVRHILRLHTEAVGAQMVDPRAAAASPGILVDDHGLRCVRAFDRAQRRSHNDNEELPSFHFTTPSRGMLQGECARAVDPGQTGDTTI
jgi:hypothetical protein